MGALWQQGADLKKKYVIPIKKEREREDVRYKGRRTKETRSYGEKE